MVHEADWREGASEWLQVHMYMYVHVHVYMHVATCSCCLEREGETLACMKLVRLEKIVYLDGRFLSHLYAYYGICSSHAVKS